VSALFVGDKALPKLEEEEVGRGESRFIVLAGGSMLREVPSVAWLQQQQNPTVFPAFALFTPEAIFPYLQLHHQLIEMQNRFPGTASPTACSRPRTTKSYPAADASPSSTRWRGRTTPGSVPAPPSSA
jgi:hypothetical protein